MTDIRYIRQTGPDPLLQVDTTWEDIRFPTSSLLTVGVNDPDLIKFQDDGGSSPGVYCYGFDNVVREDVFFQAQLPHSYKLGTDLYPHVHWSPTTAAAGTVIWGLEYTVAMVNGTFGTTTIVEVTDDADGVAKKHQVVGWTAISGTGITSISAMVMGRVYRKATADSYGADAALLEIDIHFEIDTPSGSREPFSK